MKFLIKIVASESLLVTFVGVKKVKINKKKNVAHLLTRSTFVKLSYDVCWLCVMRFVYCHGRWRCVFAMRRFLDVRLYMLLLCSCMYELFSSLSERTSSRIIAIRLTLFWQQQQQQHQCQNNAIDPPRIEFDWNEKIQNRICQFNRKKRKKNLHRYMWVWVCVYVPSIGPKFKCKHTCCGTDERTRVSMT